ncbi:obelin-like [Lingula anatina]|uniref:Obelin-like n=1 Tax=Lingula anatina TaxID=7574 RepID=A0A1S3HVQ8_LINAN|nr:obelin-like [Lingula anatina]|eukprot:XP_013390120.1 obelin-like [Lingula anatina]
MFSIKFGLLLLAIVLTFDSSYGVKVAQGNNKDFTPYWLKKYKKFFDIFDVNKDGNVTKEEYIDLSTERAALPSWRAKAVYGAMTMGFQTWWSNEYTNYKTSIVFEDWVKSEENVVGFTSDLVVEWALDVFHIVDLDCSEELTLNEYSKFLDIFRNTADNKVIFSAIDSDGDNVIDAKEFTYAVKDYTYDQAAKSAAYIFGSRD